MEPDLLAAITRAALAPSVHNVQPWRWKREGATLILGCDLAVGLSAGDPEGHDAGLSCGAAAEAMVLALSEQGVQAQAEDCWHRDDRRSIPGHRVAAVLRWEPGGAPDPLAAMLEARFTYRGMFDPAPVALFGWSRQDVALVTDLTGRARMGARNDWAALQIMRNQAFRHELLGWMRLHRRHPRYDYDGLNRAALRMSRLQALGARMMLGPLWGLADRLGLTAAMTAEAQATQSAPVIACFHCASEESPVTSGRAYLRMCLEAAHLGLAGWPMAALSDHPVTRTEVCERFGIGAERRLVQVIRFGRPMAAPPPRARRPMAEVYL